MFFAEKITTLQPSDRVLEVGPGSCPHPRADVLLEKSFPSEAEAFSQRGRTTALSTDKPLVSFDGGKFPFRDKEFDYVICAHVLEHVEDIESFCSELSRVAHRGYIEFPTVYYDYLYDIPEHVTLLFWQNGVLRHMPKSESGIRAYRNITGFLFFSLRCGLDALIRPCMPVFFQGFEWSGSLTLQRATGVSELCWTLPDGGEPVPTAPETSVTALVFSKNRAMQLDALLASLKLHCTDQECLKIRVLFACSSDQHRDQYRELAAAHPEVSFLEETEFQSQVLNILNEAAKILFLVDDSLFVRPFSVRRLSGLLDERCDAAGVSLRLGRNTTYCYPLNTLQTLPCFNAIGDGFLEYEWPHGDGDFGYPLEVSSSCYRSGDILTILASRSFATPNHLEGVLASAARSSLLPGRKFLVCPEQSLAFSCPVNVVQTCCCNRHETLSELTPESLANLFAQGKRIAVEAYSGLVPGACHQPVPLVIK